MKEYKVSLKAARVNSRLDTKEICKRMNKSVFWLSLIENGKRNIYAKDLFKLVDIYNVPIQDIFLPTNDTFSKKKNNKK